MFHGSATTRWGGREWGRLAGGCNAPEREDADGAHAGCLAESGTLDNAYAGRKKGKGTCHSSSSQAPVPAPSQTSGILQGFCLMEMWGSHWMVLFTPPYTWVCCFSY